MINTIIDIYHQNDIDLEAARDGGITAVIHKATQGTTKRDSRYHQRRKRAKNLGLLWGGYHFSTGESVSEQVENFLDYARPEDDELISLDWERSPGPDMTLHQARDFVQMIKDETGRYSVIYGGDLLRESIGHQSDATLSNCPLWYARYTNAPIGIPTQVWPTYTLWQYTDGDIGPQPHSTPGAGAGVDRSIFQGTTRQLRAQWPFTQRDEGVPYGPGFAAILSAPAPQVPKKKKGGKK
jgi:lysozyme